MPPVALKSEPGLSSYGLQVLLMMMLPEPQLVYALFERFTGIDSTDGLTPLNDLSVLTGAATP